MQHSVMESEAPPITRKRHVTYSLKWIICCGGTGGLLIPPKSGNRISVCCQLGNVFRGTVWRNHYCHPVYRQHSMPLRQMCLFRTCSAFLPSCPSDLDPLDFNLLTFNRVRPAACRPQRVKFPVQPASKNITPLQ